MTRILVFDSGIGGLSVFDSIAVARLDLEIDYAADNAWLPYGEKSDDALRDRVPALLAALARQLTPDLIVMACNTASTIALAETRAAISLPVVGVVPPIKPAAERSRSGVIGLLATPATVRRPYTDDLIARFAAHAHVIRVGDVGLVAAAEAKLSDAPSDPLPAVRAAVEALFEAPRGDELDAVALACTHFPLLAEELRAAAPRDIAWLDSGAAIARRVADVLQASTGAVRPRRVLFTGAESGASSAEAFAARGFSELCAIGEAPDFRCAPRSVLSDA